MHTHTYADTYMYTFPVVWGPRSGNIGGRAGHSKSSSGIAVIAIVVPIVVGVAVVVVLVLILVVVALSI